MKSKKLNLSKQLKSSKSCGAFRKIQQMMDVYIKEAEVHLKALPDSPAKERLKELAHFMIKRNF